MIARVRAWLTARRAARVAAFERARRSAAIRDGIEDARREIAALRRRHGLPP